VKAPKRLIIGLLIVIVSLFFIFVPLKKYTYQGFYFDTYIKVKFFARNPLKAKKTIKLLKGEFERIDQIPVKGIKAGKIDSALVHIIKGSLKISKMSEGAFDPTVDPVLNAWHYFKEPVIPSKETIDSLLTFVDYRKVVLIGDSLSLPRGMSINIGGSAKGYALNCIRNIFKEMEIHSALTEAGGDIVLVGRKKGNNDWLIGVRHPRDRNGVIGICNLSDCFIATAGDYERCFFIDSIRYHHIINPETGYPVREMQSVTVIGEDGLIVDGLSTALFAMGMNRALEFVEENQLEAIIVDSSGKIHSFTERFKLGDL